MGYSLAPPGHLRNRADEAANGAEEMLAANVSTPAYRRAPRKSGEV
jgi:hypothetical protein